jgi:hypothetical protein
MSLTPNVASLKPTGRGSLVALTTNADDWNNSRIRAGRVRLIECLPIGGRASIAADHRTIDSSRPQQALQHQANPVRP